MARRQGKTLPTSETLQGWKAIAEYLGQPVPSAQRWAKDGMPVQRSGRFVTAQAKELDEWIARESQASAPVHVARVGERDLVAELQRGLREARKRK
jgi:hypothetical protein